MRKANMKPYKLNAPNDERYQPQNKVYGSGSQPVGRHPFEIKWPFYKGHLRPLEILDIYTTVHNRSKIRAAK